VVNGLTRGAGGIYSPQNYDYTETYDQDEPGAEHDYYYYEPDDAAPPASGSADNAAAELGSKSGKGLWRRWWPGS
jgi:hypothetical protein